MLNRFPGYGDALDYADQKIKEAIDIGDIELAERRSKAVAGLLRNRSNLALSEMGRQADLNKARQIAQKKSEEEQAEYDRANAERLNALQYQFPGFFNAIEVGPAGYQPGFQGGMDFANPADMVVPPPDNKYGQSLLDGIEQGSQKAKEQNQGLLSQQQEQGFFGNIGEYINEDFLGRVLAIMARPEAFTDPRGLGAGIARAGQAVFAQEKEQAEQEMKRQRLENEAKRQAFLDKIRLEELGLSRRRAELSEKTEERIAGKPVTVKNPTKKEYTELENRFDLIQGMDDYLNKISSTWLARLVDGKLESKDTVKKRLIYAANERAQREGIPFEEAVKREAGLSGTPVVDDLFMDINT